ncbi:MAG: hypothetical protein QXK37_01920 [Candidatus Woesearchaeota archaeon]
MKKRKNKYLVFYWIALICVLSGISFSQNIVNTSSNTTGFNGSNIEDDSKSNNSEKNQPNSLLNASQQINFSVSVERESYYPNESVYIYITAGPETLLNITVSTANSVQNYSTVVKNSTVLLYTPLSTGIYNIKAVFSYSGQIIEREASFSVVEPLSCFIKATHGTTGEEVSLNPDIRGGIPPYLKSWNYGDGTYGSEDKHTYNAEHDYPVRLIVEDSKKRSFTCYRNLEIKDKLFTLTVYLQDNRSEEFIGDALVSINGTHAKSNINGRAFFENLKEGIYRAKVEHLAYQTREFDVNLTQSMTVYEKLTIKPESERGVPRIEIIGPDDGIMLHERTATFNYKVESKTPVSYCKLLFNQVGLLGMRVKGEQINVSRGEVQKFEANLTNGNFKWKIRCMNEAGEGFSDEHELFVSGLVEEKPNKNTENIGTATETDNKKEVSPKVYDLSNELQKIDAALAEIDQALRRVSAYDEKETIAAGQIKLSKDMQESKQKLTVLREKFASLQSLQISHADFESRTAEYKRELSQIMQETKTGVRVIEVEDYIEKLNEEELAEIAKSYLASKNRNLNDKQFKKFVRSCVEAQEKIKVEAKIENIEIEYMSGERRNIAIVEKVVTTRDNISGLVFVEFVPKTLASDFNKIRIEEQVELINADPLFAVDIRSVGKFKYILEGKKLVSELKSTKSALIIRADEAETLTGFVIEGSVLSLKGVLLLILVATVLIAGYYSVNYNEESKGEIKKMIKSIVPAPAHSRLHDKLIECLNHIEQNRHTKAFAMYEDIIKLYQKCSEEKKAVTGHAIIFLKEELDYYLFCTAIDDAKRKLLNCNKEELETLRSEISDAYEKLSNRHKESTKGRFVSFNIVAQVIQMKAEKNNVNQENNTYNINDELFGKRQ